MHTLALLVLLLSEHDASHWELSCDEWNQARVEILSDENHTQDAKEFLMISSARRCQMNNVRHAVRTQVADSERIRSSSQEDAKSTEGTGTRITSRVKGAKSNYFRRNQMHKSHTEESSMTLKSTTQRYSQKQLKSSVTI